MAYKIDDNNIIFDSDGKTVLLTNSEILFDGSTTIGNTLYDLPDTYFLDRFKFPAQGTQSGYRSGGRTTNNIVTIDKFPFSSDTNATDVGDLTQGRQLPAGQSSNTHGYTSGGLRTNPPFSPPYNSNIIDKFPFAVDANATDVGNLTKNTYFCTGVSSTFHGYTAGGRATPPPQSPDTDIISKFPFTSDTNAAFVGSLIIASAGSGQNGTMNAEAGYINGKSGPTTDTVQKFPFATDANAYQVGNLIGNANETSGSNSTTHAYVSGGDPPVIGQVIQKYAFATEGTATDVGDLSGGYIQSAGGSSSTTNGYVLGGEDLSNNLNTIEKFPFSSDANSTDVGDLTEAVRACAGQQA